MGYSDEMLVVAGWATYRVVNLTFTSCARGMVGPSKKLPISGWYLSSSGADLSWPKLSMQILVERTFVRSSRFMAVS